MAALRNAAAVDRIGFPLSAGHRHAGVQPQAQCPVAHFVGGRAVPVHRPDLAGPGEGAWRPHGLSGYAAAISKDSDGRYHADRGTKDAILALRKDPQISALMAGEYAKTTEGAMRASLGREVCGGELYAAHFLGPDAACKLIRLAGSEPGASAAAQFPQAAGANKSVFFHADGEPKSVREVYDWALRQPGGSGHGAHARRRRRPTP